MKAKSVFLLFVEYFLSQILVAVLISIDYGGLPLIYKLTPPITTNAIGASIGFYQYFMIPFGFLVAINFISFIFTKKLFHQISIKSPFFTYKYLLIIEIALIALIMAIQIPLNLSYYGIAALPPINLGFAGNFLGYYIYTILNFSLPVFIISFRILFYFCKLTNHITTSQKFVIELFFVLAALFMSVLQVYQFNSWQQGYSFETILGKDAEYIFWFFPFVYLQTRFLIMGLTLLIDSFWKKTVYPAGLILKIILVCIPSFTIFCINIFKLDLGMIFGLIYTFLFIPYNLIFLNLIFIISNVMELKTIKKQLAK